MNALVNFRANGLGNLTVTHKQRQAAMDEITSAYRAKAAAVAKSANVSKQATTGGASTVTETASRELGRDAFLQLLVVQLQHQDPLEPVDNSAMLAQLAQFSALEQSESLNSNFEFLAGNIDQLNFISSQGLLGKYVEGLNQDGQISTGTVDSVYLDGSIVVLNVGGDILNMSNVLAIRDQAPEGAGGGSGSGGGEGGDSSGS